MKDELVVITGSSNRFGEEIYALAEELKFKWGTTIIVDSMFHKLSEPKARKQFMRTILDADKLIVYNKDGYIGFHTNFEIVLALIAGIEIEYWFPGQSPVLNLQDIEQLYNSSKE